MNLGEKYCYTKGQTLFIAEINSSANIKLDLAEIFNQADKLLGKLLSLAIKEQKIFFRDLVI